jgi:hypothetical protein
MLYLWGKRPQYPLYRMDELQSKSGCFKEKKNLLPMLRIKPQFLHCPVCNPKRTSQFTKTKEMEISVTTGMGAVGIHHQQQLQVLASIMHVICRAERLAIGVVH